MASRSRSRRRSPSSSARRAVALLLLAACGTAPLVADEIPLADRRSGYDSMSRDSQAMQDDETANPGMLAVLQGAALWTAKTGAAQRACADCHGDAAASMRDVATRYPAYDATRGRAIDLEERINICRSERQQAPALAWESKELLALATFVARQSRGRPIAPPDEARMTPVVAQGRRLFEMRQGQLNLSCAQCHDDNWGRKLAGNAVPQGHPTGYPIYRLEWQSVGSLQRRLRNCLTGMRAEPYPFGSEEMVALEAFLMWRARGMPLETPAVRP